MFQWQGMDCYSMLNCSVLWKKRSNYNPIQNNYDYNVLDNDDYYHLQGSFNVAIRYCEEGMYAYHIDVNQTMQSLIIIRRLKQELIRTATCKLLNKD